MNDMYDNELFEEGAEPQQEEKKSNPEKIIKICLGIVIVALVVVVALSSILLASRGGNEESTAPTDETTTLSEEITTSPAEKYSAGQYTVNVGASGTLRLRKDASKDAEILQDIPNGTLITVSEVKYDETAEEGSRYWGKTVYLGWDGWVSMIYLANAYSESIVTPDEQTTAPEGASDEATTAAPEATTAAPEATTAAPEATTAAPEITTSASESTTASTGASNAYATGKYTVDAQPHLNMRDGHSVNALAIAQIPDNAEVTVVEVYHDASSTDSYTKYWGKVTYQGITGWVAMGYLE